MLNNIRKYFSKRKESIEIDKMLIIGCKLSEKAIKFKKAKLFKPSETEIEDFIKTCNLIKNEFVKVIDETLKEDNILLNEYNAIFSFKDIEEPIIIKDIEIMNLLDCNNLGMYIFRFYSYKKNKLSILYRTILVNKITLIEAIIITFIIQLGLKIFI